MEVYLIASYRPLHSGPISAISCSNYTLTKYAEHSRVEFEPKPISDGNRILGMLTLNKLYQKKGPKSPKDWQFLVYGESTRALVSQDLSTEKELVFPSSLNNVKTCAESDKYWIIGNCGFPLHLFNKETLELVHKPEKFTVKTNIAFNGDNMQNSLIVHKQVAYLISNLNKAMSLELYPPFTETVYFEDENFEDLCEFKNDILAASTTGAVRYLRTGRKGQIDIPTEEILTHIRSFESNLFVIVKKEDPIVNFVYLLSSKLTVVCKIGLHRTDDHIRNVAITHTKNIGILWINHRCSALSVVLFNKNKLILVDPNATQYPDKMHFGMALLTPTSVIIAPCTERSKVAHLRLKMS